MNNQWFYQVIRRNNDPSEKPFKLVMVYCPDDSGKGYRVESCYAVRSSQISQLEMDLAQQENVFPIEELHVSPREYRAISIKYAGIISYAS